AGEGRLAGTRVAEQHDALGRGFGHHIKCLAARLTLVDLLRASDIQKVDTGGQVRRLQLPLGLQLLPQLLGELKWRWVFADAWLDEHRSQTKRGDSFLLRGGRCLWGQ